MTNVYFPDEQIRTDDLYFVCYMIERVARQLKQPNKYVANKMGHDALAKKLSLADVLHSENPLAVAADWTPYRATRTMQTVFFVFTTTPFVKLSIITTAAPITSHRPI